MILFYLLAIYFIPTDFNVSMWRKIYPSTDEWFNPESSNDNINEYTISSSEITSNINFIRIWCEGRDAYVYNILHSLESNTAITTYRLQERLYSGGNNARHFFDFVRITKNFDNTVTILVNGIDGDGINVSDYRYNIYRIQLEM